MDQIWRWDSVNVCWAKYGYQKPARGGTAAWRKYNAATDSFSDLTASDVVYPGETFLYFRGNNGQASFTLSGAVKEFTASPQYTINKGNYSFVARPWPIGFRLSDLNEIATWSSLSTVPGFGSGMDQIWRWDSANVCWAKYGYQKPARGGTAAWRKYNAATDSFSDLTDSDAVADNEGFLYFRGNNATLTLTFKALQPAE